MKYGFVYILSNESMPGIYKVGFTLKHPRERMAELSKATSCPTPFELLAFFDHADPEWVEQQIHAALPQYRVNSGREFFRVLPDLLQDQCRQWGDPACGAFYTVPLDHLVDVESVQLISRGA